MPNLEMKTLSLREVKKRAQGHTASGWLGLKLGQPSSRIPALDYLAIQLSCKCGPSKLGGPGRLGCYTPA